MTSILAIAVLLVIFLSAWRAIFGQKEVKVKGHWRGSKGGPRWVRGHRRRRPGQWW